MSWSVEKAIKAAKLMAPYDILFLEEPTIPEDYEGYARIAKEGQIAVAGGENLRTYRICSYDQIWQCRFSATRRFQLRWDHRLVENCCLNTNK